MVGGFAAVTHGATYLTRDVDICVVLTDENVAKVRQALGDWNPTHRMTPQKLSFLRHPAAGQKINKLYLQTDMGVVDILTSILGVGDFVGGPDHGEGSDGTGKKPARGQGTAGDPSQATNRTGSRLKGRM